MSAQENTEKVLKKLHIAISKSPEYEGDNNKIIVDKYQMIGLLKNLTKCMGELMEEYEMTKASKDKAEREFRKKSEEIVIDANHKAEDIYAASVLYTDEALNSIQDIMQRAQDSVKRVYTQMDEKLAEQKRIVKSNQSELKSQLEGLVDTDKYLKLIEERNREIKKAKALRASGLKYQRKKFTPSYNNIQPEVKINPKYFEKLGMTMDEADSVANEDFGDFGNVANFEPFTGELESYDTNELNEEYLQEIAKNFDVDSFIEEERSILPQETDIQVNLNSAYFKKKKENQEISEKKNNDHTKDQKSEHIPSKDIKKRSKAIIARDKENRNKKIYLNQSPEKQERLKRVSEPIERLDLDDEDEEILTQRDKMDEVFLKKLKEEEESAYRSLANEVQKLMKDN
ncbi:hypothetical protein [Lachnobacterium bovis]|uniref:hypothetical protein n=1 Tax=Lachnobacterium bovis TaxID=140626 RepID=UPI00068E19EA|nr:hypothetical protein [Lachnobacterium bovis]